MTSVSDAARCPQCGLTLLEHAQLKNAVPRRREQTQLLEALKAFVPRYKAQNDALEQSLRRTTHVGGSFHRGSHRFNSDT